MRTVATLDIYSSTENVSVEYDAAGNIISIAHDPCEIFVMENGGYWPKRPITFFYLNDFDEDDFIIYQLATDGTSLFELSGDWGEEAVKIGPVSVDLVKKWFRNR